MHLPPDEDGEVRPLHHAAEWPDPPVVVVEANDPLEAVGALLCRHWTVTERDFTCRDCLRHNGLGYGDEGDWFAASRELRDAVPRGTMIDCEHVGGWRVDPGRPDPGARSSSTVTATAATPTTTAKSHRPPCW